MTISTMRRVLDRGLPNENGVGASVAAVARFGDARIDAC